MVCYERFNLQKHNNLRLNSVAEKFYIPESKDGLIELLKLFKSENQNFYFLSGGSNVLLKPSIKSPIIFVQEVDKTLSYYPETNTVVSGCSVKIQTLINFLADNSLGGIEYLYSLPALVGGCVCMNAGRGRQHNLSISDFIIAVEYADENGLHEVEKKECGFGYRKSIFQNSAKCITKTVFQFPFQATEVTKKNIKDRLEYVKIYQEPQKPSLGSIFSAVDFRIMKLVAGLKVGKATYSKKTLNWISNLGNATYTHVIILIYIVSVMSFLTGRKAKLEVKLWK